MADETSSAADQVAEVAQKVAPTASEAVDKIAAEAGMLADLFGGFLTRLQQPWTLYQMGIIFGMIVLAHFLKLWLRPKLRTWLASQGYQKWVLRFSVVFVNRFALLMFTIMSWCTYWVMQSITWPSRSYFIYVAAAIATSWFLIAGFSRLVKNNSLRNILRWLASGYAALKITGLWDNSSRLLDSIAFETQGFRLSLLMILTALCTLAVLFVLASSLTKNVNNKLSSSTDIDPSIKVLLQKVAQIVFYGAAFLIGLKTIGFDLSNLALLTGAIGLGLGFGLQKIVSNLVSGVIILLDKSIKPGDVISLGDTFGWITGLGARYASITTRDGREYLVPNEDFITSQVINWTHSSDFVRLDIHFGVAYDSDPHEVKRIATDAPKSVNRVVSAPAPVCHVINFGDSSIDFKLRFWIKDPTAGLTNIRGNVYLALWDALKENGIEIPFPRRDVHVHNSVPLIPAMPKD